MQLYVNVKNGFLTIVVVVLVAASSHTYFPKTRLSTEVVFPCQDSQPWLLVYRLVVVSHLAGFNNFAFILLQGYNRNARRQIL
jgi:hypothetical protein